MSRLLLIALSAAMAITCLAFACLLKLNEMSSWGWFLLAGCFFWGTAINLFEKREAHPMLDGQVDLATRNKPTIGKKCA